MGDGFRLQLQDVWGWLVDDARVLRIKVELNMSMSGSVWVDGETVMPERAVAETHNGNRPLPEHTNEHRHAMALLEASLHSPLPVAQKLLLLVLLLCTPMREGDPDKASCKAWKTDCYTNCIRK